MTLPYVVVRSNNVALSGIENLTQSKAVSALIVAMEEAKEAEQGLRLALMDELYTIAGNDHPDFRSILAFKAKLKNDKYNDKDLRQQQLLLQECQSGSSWLCARQKSLDLQADFSRLYEQSCHESRAAIKQLVGDDAFIKSISFTRGDIHGIVRRYANHQGNYNKKVLNDEDTIIKYLTRSIVKVSPFSSFTSIGFSKVGADAGAELHRSAGFADKFSIDRSVFLKIYDCLVSRERKYWLYRFSSNFKQDQQGKYVYSFGDSKQIYPFRSSLVKTRFPKLNLDLTRSYQYEELQEIFAEKCDSVFAHLLENGILLFDEKLDDQAADIIADFIEKLQRLKTRGFDYPEFESLLQDIYQDFLALETTEVSSISTNVDLLTDKIHQLGELVGYVSAKQGGIVYHDTLHRGVSDIKKPLVEKFSTQVSEFISHYTGVNYDAGISRRLMNSLRQAMQPGKAYSLFEFYDLAVEHLKQKENDPKKNVGEVSKLLEFYQHLWQYKDTDLLELENVDAEKLNKEHTLSAYGHVMDGNFVLNCVDGGYLRVWSRFFTFNDDDQVLDACLDAYDDALKQSYDFYDTFGFNTGRRPRLAQKRICLEESDVEGDGDLSLSQLYVKWDTADKHPKVYSHTNDQEVVLRHTALFVSQLYPKLLEILIRFSMMEKQSYFAPRFGIYDMVVQRQDVSAVKLPRVVYKDVIVSRKQWWYQKSVIPVKSASESFEEFLLRLDKWRSDAGLPSRVFVRRHSKDKVLQRDISNNKKPLFIDFHSPVMCRPISRLLNSSYDYISFEEMLPDASDNFMQVGDERFASEIIVEKVA